MPEVIIGGGGDANELLVNSDGTIGISGNITSVTSGTILEDFSLRYAQRLDYEGGVVPVYIGLANPGTNTGSASWQIRKLTYTNNMNTATLWASGNNNFDKVWDDRSGTNEAYS